MKIQLRLMLVIIPVLICVFGITTFFTSVISTSALEDQARKNAKLLSHSYSGQLDSTIRLYLNISQDLGSAVITAINIETTLQALRKRHPQFTNVFYTPASGKVLEMVPYRRQYIDFDLKNIQGWQQAFDTKSPAISVPGVYFGERSIIIFAPAILSYVANQEPTVVGMVALVLPLNHLFQGIKNVTIGNSGSIFVIDENGLFLHHKNAALILTDKLATFSNILSIRQIASAMIEQKTGFATYIDRKESKYISFSPILAVNWSLGVNGSYNEITSGINKIILINLIVVLIGVVLAIVILYFVVHSVVSPISKLTKMAQKIEKGDYQSEISIEDKGKGELAELTKTFFKMRDRIKDKIANLNKEVSERKQAEMALKKSEERYRLIAENVADVIWTMDMDLNYTYMSPSVYQLRGYTVEESMKHSLEEVLLPDSLEKVMNLFGKTLTLIESGDEKGIKPVKFEAKQTCKDGTVIWTSNNARILYGPDKQPASILGITHDITERKRAEEEKIKAQIIAGEQRKHALVGQIAGRIAHDFNNILGIIMGNTELSLLKCKDSKTIKTLELILEQTLRGRNLTKNLVAFAKDQEPKQEFFRINEKIDLVVNLMRKDLNGIELLKKESSGVPELLADPGMIEHALVNLIQNSIHATSMSEHPQIIIRTYSLDNNICFEIEDNGCGIPKELIENIFEPSFTLKGLKDVTGSYKTDIKGTGYGMANVKKYIEQHKGTISVESQLGSGTKFTISLPVIKKKLTNEEKIKISEELSHFEKYILLVEDETAISDVQYRVLTQDPCNHKVDIAINGQIAIDLFDRNEYDFISLDYILPGNINGIDVYNHIRETNKTVPILFISGNLEFLESIKELKQKDNNIEHLSKPCQNKDYVSSINRLLERTSSLDRK